MNANTFFPVGLEAYSEEGEGDQNSEQTAIVEVLSHDKDGLVIAFNDRGERVFLSFRLSALIAAVENLDRK